MKTKPVTFDSIDISVHNRYAKDQQTLDPIFITEPHIIAPHSEITGTSSIYSSKWEELFDINKRSTTWALFDPPASYFSQSNRFFSYCLMPDLYWDLEEHQEDSEKSEVLSLPEFFSFQKKKRPSKKEITALSALLIKDSSINIVHFEKDKNVILSMIESIEKLNKLLSIVYSRKLQYQKG